MDNNTDTGTQYPALVAAGVDVRLKTGSGYILHHKYCVIDAEDPAWSPVTITGSHNWSNSAETSNNENTLIIQDHPIANLYLQEFTARYYQYGGSDTIRVGVDAQETLPLTTRLEQNYPNPFNPSTTITIALAEKAHVLLRVYDLLGREVAMLYDGPLSAGTASFRFDARGLASGAYLVRMQAGGVTATRRILLVR
jgi:phosphatidylserine/phosphatidylglycerophosphate/cardiolipin synthase-like enzyme